MRSRRGLCVDRRLGRGCARARRVRGVFFSIHHAPLGPIRNIRGAVEVIAISRLNDFTPFTHRDRSDEVPRLRTRHRFLTRTLPSPG